MKKMMMVTALTLTAAAAFADTQSPSGFYVGAGVSNTKTDSDSTTFTPIELFGGYKLNSFVGGEVRVGSSSGNPKITNFESIYYRTESANSVGKTYLLAGYSHVDLEANSGNYNFNGFSYGAGLGVVINDHFNLNLEYKVLVDSTGTLYKDKFTEKELDLKLSSVTATVDYRF